MVNNNKHIIECDLCHGEFTLTPDLLKDEQVTLEKEGLSPHEVTITFLLCPHCGKRYVVIVDDAKTLVLRDKLINIRSKINKLARMGKTSAEYAKKFKDANWKLDFYRRKLAEKYYLSFYQLEDGTKEQLDFRYQAR